MREFTATWYHQSHPVRFEDELWAEHRRYRVRLTRRLRELVSKHQYNDPEFATTVASLLGIIRENMISALPQLFVPPLQYKLTNWQQSQEARTYQIDRVCQIADTEALDPPPMPGSWPWTMDDPAHAKLVWYRRARLQIRINDETSYRTWVNEGRLTSVPVSDKVVGAPFRFLSIDNDGNLRYWDRWEDVGDPKRWKAMSLGKFWRRMRHKYGMLLTDEFIDKFAELLGGMHGDDEYQFEFRSGTDIIDTYREAYFGSCMHRSSSINVYANTEGLQIMRIMSKGKLVGRALVWQTTCERTVLDRVYPSDGGSHIDAAMEYARSRGWVYKVDHCIGGRLSERDRFTVVLPESAEYPYMDTFMYTDGPYDGSVVLNNVDGEYELTSTEGHAPWNSAMVYCEFMGRDYPEDEVEWVASVDMYVSHDAIERYFIADLNGDYIEECYSVCIANTGKYFDYRDPPPGIVYNEYTDEHYDTDYCDVVEATAGRCAGEYFYIDELVEHDGEYYWNQDDELPAEESEEEE